MSPPPAGHPSGGLRGDWPRDPSYLSGVEEHRARILAEIDVPAAFAQPIMESLGLVCTDDVVSEISLPRFENSAMDGYAVHHADVLSATPETPVVLPVVGQIGAGQSGAGQADLRELSAGSAAKIMTGAPTPAGCDTVVPYEWTDRGADKVTITRAPVLRQHLRSAGEDVAAGDLLITAGTVLGPRHVGLMAAVGRSSVLVRPRPRVVVISTGTELREPGHQLDHDSIFDGNSYLLAAAVRGMGAIAYRVGIVPDQAKAFTEALQDQLVRADLVITSGGVSQGDWDVVKEALSPQGVWFGPVAMQPGRPQGFGLLDDGRVPIFTLPGNPVSAYVSFEVFVLPALRKLMGMTPEARPEMRARLTSAVTSPPGRRQYLRGRVALDSEGPYVAPVGGAGSHLIGELAGANCLIVVPDDLTAVPAGASVGILLLDEEF